ncbi:hypothetical protein [Kribbella sp. VKM Ac-2568]|uniref:hypothetical protein n=1 Tax=Kribbella sp. VKM Ac-2568 TaxID=2512219 RepID=UPI0010F18FA0|nr:hypothetical protein [Kribbella sp. VKM Ac-2568]TCM43455.1 hypothetical protein EV648_10974 [Kribbella sp. VKM Ac-2568]
MRPSRRQVLLAGTVVAASTVAVTETATAAGGYGSGDIVDWRGFSRAISSEAIIRSVLARNGVFMFGDSIAVQDGRSLATRLAGRTGDPLAVHNWSGRPTTPAVDVLAQWAQNYGLPRRILMATGTNDIFNPPVFAGQVDRTMAIVGRTRTVVWVNVQIARTTQPAAVQVADQRNGAWINLQLCEAQRRHPNLRLVRWAEYLAAKPTRLTVYLRSGVHTTVPAGQNARNELIVLALAAAR